MFSKEVIFLRKSSNERPTNSSSTENKTTKSRSSRSSSSSGAKSTSKPTANGKRTSSVANKKASDKKTKTSPSKAKSVSSVKKTTSTKTKSSTKKKSGTNRVTMTQNDMDKLCEVYDWYLQIKDRVDFSKVGLHEIPNYFNNMVNQVQDENIEKKILNTKIDKDVWEDFDRLCKNLDAKKSDMINFILKKVISDFSDII